MRITNKIMQNNSLYNINNNKLTEDQLNNMLATGKKITRPSDDPIIAIRDDEQFALGGAATIGNGSSHATEEVHRHVAQLECSGELVLPIDRERTV